jgi:drug/metabolite transporter (DMT)-like permease
MKLVRHALRLSPEIQGESILLLTALLWGLSFVSQRLGMRTMGPFTFNAIRYALGAISILPLIFLRRLLRHDAPPVKASIISGGVCGIFLFLGASFQQLGVVTTSAGKAGFITGIYVILVPLLGLFLKRKSSWGIWIGSVLALVGLFFLSVRENFSMGSGDVLVLVGAFFWALHILMIGRFAKKADGLIMSCAQFLACSFLSLCLAIPFERTSLSGIAQAALPIAYSGIVSIGIAFTLQIYGQKRAHPAKASIIMSLESLFAAVFGIIFLGEDFGFRTALGSLLILSGMIAAQIEPKKIKPDNSAGRSNEAAKERL